MASQFRKVMNDPIPNIQQNITELIKKIDLIEESLEYREKSILATLWNKLEISDKIITKLTLNVTHNKKKIIEQENKIKTLENKMDDYDKIIADLLIHIEHFESLSHYYK